jgi:2-amino-4-hydroxy-6-hydroxymethyldihydropteridine diphosphokinase
VFSSREGTKERAFISIGSNLGDRVKNLDRAIEGISRNPAITLIKKSSFYQTTPWGRTDQPLFINCAVEVETSLEPRQLLGFLKALEAKLGRTPATHKGDRWGPRVIDLDIVFYGDRIIEEEGLVIPHPHALERGFVMVPIEEIAPDLIYPGSGKKVSELTGGLEDREEVKRLIKEQ